MRRIAYLSRNFARLFAQNRQIHDVPRDHQRKENMQADEPVGPAKRDPCHGIAAVCSQ
jgi:hypothetical protein